MHSVPMPSKTGSSVTSVSVTPPSASTSPIRAPVSSSSTTGSSGARDSRTKRIMPTRSTSAWRASRQAVRNDHDSRTRATPRMPIAHPADSSSWGWRIFSMPS